MGEISATELPNLAIANLCCAQSGFSTAVLAADIAS